MEKQLLHTPEGVRDIYNGECSEKILIENRIAEVFKNYGYARIQTPSFEFFDVFNKERGSVASNQMYKFFDRDNNTMVLRPDMTPGIARCAAKYYENESAPVRLCYIGNTFINNSSYQGRLKEITEAGCELIGDSSVRADAEMIALIIDSILAAGLKDFQVEVGHVGFFKGLADSAGLSEEATGKLRTIIRNKMLFSIENLLSEEQIAPEFIDVFYKLPQMFGNVDILNSAKTMTDSREALQAIEHLEQVYELLKIYGFEKYVSFDLGVLSELDYYTGVIFKAYTYDVGEPIAKGGRYDKLIGQFGSDKASIGFGIVIDRLQLAITRQNIILPVEDKGKLLVADEKNTENAIKLAKSLRNSGIAATIVPEMTDASGYSEVITVDETVLERFGVK